MLRYHEFKILAKYTATDSRELNPNEELPADLPRDLVIELGHRGFADWNNHEEEALSYIGADFIVRTDAFISSAAPASVEADFIDRTVQQVKNEINGRLEVQLTGRDFISPYLVGAIRMIRQHLRNKRSERKLSLVCEKFVCGLKAAGPVDYVIALDCCDIVVTEAKDKHSAQEGVLPNLLQQHASLEFLSNVLMDPCVTGSNRKKRSREEFEGFWTLLPTFGVVSNGVQWIFTKCYRSAGEPTQILQSNPIHIDYRTHSTVGDLEPSVRRILFVIANITIEQITQWELHCGANTAAFQGITQQQLLAVQREEADEVIREEAIATVECCYEYDDADGSIDEWQHRHRFFCGCGRGER